MSALPTQTRHEPLIQWWWVQLPLRVARVFPTLGRTLSDGLYLAQWPPIAALAPPAVLAVALLLGIFHPGETFTYSVLVMGIFIALGLLSLQLGAWALLGYILGDFLLHSHIMYGRASLGQFLWLRLALLLSYFLLALVVMGVPLVGAAVRLRLRALTLPAWPRLLVESIGYGSVVGFLVYLWVRAVPVLIRPVFTWRGTTPGLEDILPLQGGVWLLVGVAVSALLLRLVLEGLARGVQVMTLAQRSTLAFSRLPSKPVSPPGSGYLLIGASALLLTLLLAGMISNPFEGVLVFAFLALLAWARDRVATAPPPPLHLLGKVPLLLRFILGLALSYGISWGVMTLLWETTQTFRPALIATCLSVATLTLLVAIREPTP